MLKIGLTGGIGSGKSTVSGVFEMLGIPVFYADDAAKAVMKTDKLLKSSIKDIFGRQSYDSSDQLDRKYLADIVFNNEKELAKLNNLVHPAVFRAFDNWLSVQKKAPYILKEAALLFESGSYKLCDKNILVTAPVDLRLKRVCKRDGLSEKEVEARMNKQFTDKQTIQLADFIIKNDEQQLLIPQVLKLHQHFLSLS